MVDASRPVRDVLRSQVEDIFGTCRDLLLAFGGRKSHGRPQLDPTQILEKLVEQDNSLTTTLHVLERHQKFQEKISRRKQEIEELKTVLAKLLDGLNLAKADVLEVCALRSKLVGLAEDHPIASVSEDIVLYSQRLALTGCCGVRWEGQDVGDRDMRFLPPCPQEPDFQRVHLEMWHDLATFGFTEVETEAMYELMFMDSDTLGREPAPVSPVSAAASEEEVVEVSVAVDKEREEMWGAAVDDEVEEAWGIAGPELAVPDDSDDELLDDDSAASDDSMFKSSEEEDNVEAEQDAGQEDDGQEPEGTGAEDTQGTSGLLDGDDDGGDWMGVAPAEEEAGEKPPQLERLKTVEEDTDEQMQDIAFT